jgi:hypothetical protein
VIYTNSIFSDPGHMKTQRIFHLHLDAQGVNEDLARAQQFPSSDAYNEFICGEWRSQMLWNHSGDASDNLLTDYQEPARMTAIGLQLPYLAHLLKTTFDLQRLRFARLARLTPGSVLVPHRDYLELQDDLTRIHIPLTTNAKCFSAEDNTIYQMKAGEVWYIDATQVHSAANFSRQQRTHLILDFTNVQQLDNLLLQAVPEPAAIPAENIVPRKPLLPAEREALFALAPIVNETNCKDLLALLIKKYFTAAIDVATVVDWALQIAKRSGDAAAVARIAWIHEHCLVRR